MREESNEKIEPKYMDLVIVANRDDDGQEATFSTGRLTSIIKDRHGTGYRINRLPHTWRHCELINDEQARNFRKEAEL